MKNFDVKALAAKLGKNKYVLLVLLLGLVLLLLPTGGSGETERAGESESTWPAFSLEEEEARLQTLLAQIQGAGKVEVILSLQSTAERIVAETEEGPAILSAGSGGEQALELKYLYPVYQGAVVVCQGADSAQVRLDITEAVASFTGLGSDAITVKKMQ